MDPDLAALAQRLTNMVDGLQDQNLATVVHEPIGQAAVDINRDEVADVLGPSLRFRNWRDGGEVTLDYTVEGRRMIIAPPPDSIAATLVLERGRRSGRTGRTSGHGTHTTVITRIKQETPRLGLDALADDLKDRFTRG